VKSNREIPVINCVDSRAERAVWMKVQFNLGEIRIVHRPAFQLRGIASGFPSFEVVRGMLFLQLLLENE
jgi:hypothetical protein